MISPITISAGEVTIYDKDSNITERWIENDRYPGATIETYNKDWSRKGYIKKEGDKWVIYDSKWNRQGYIKGDQEGLLPKKEDK